MVVTGEGNGHAVSDYGIRGFLYVERVRECDFMDTQTLLVDFYLMKKMSILSFAVFHLVWGGISLKPRVKVHINRPPVSFLIK